MNIPEFAVKRPITVLMIVFAIFLLGLVSFPQLKLDLLPDISFPLITVVTVYPGAGPEEVETFVSRPIEEAVAVCENLKEVMSYSREGVSVVVVRFEWGTDMDYAAIEAREKVDPVIENLPEDCHRPIITKLDLTAIMPTMGLRLSGPQGLMELKKLADDVVKVDLEKVEGVASAAVMGGLERAILVEVDKGRLEAYDLSIQQVAQAIQMENLNIPSGSLTESKTEYMLRTLGQFNTPDELSNIAVANRGETPVLLKDIAQVKDSHKEQRSYARFNGKPTVALIVQKQAVANTIEVSDKVQKAIEKIQKKLPAGAELGIVFDQAEFIRHSIHNLKAVAIEGAVLAVVIIFLFLATIRSTVVIALSIPISLFVAFIYMFFTKSTLNIITMGGLVIAIGRIIDDSIVVLENIHRHIERGEKPIRAAVAATNEVGMAIAASTFTTVAAFFPVVFVTGIAQQLFSSLVWVFVVALFASLGVAFFAVPMFSPRVLRPVEAATGFTFVDQIVLQFNRGYRRVEAIYRGMLNWCLGHRKAVVGMGVVVFVVSIMLILIVGLEFIPEMDRGDFTVNIETPPGTSLEETNSVVKQVEDFALAIPELERGLAYCGEAGGGMGMMMGGGITGGGGVQTGTLMVDLVARKERHRTTKQVQDELRLKFQQIAGAKIKFTETMGGGMGGEAPIEVKISGDDLGTLSELGNKLMAKMGKIREFRDLDLNWRPGSPEYQIVIDRAKAGTLGVTAGQIGSTVRTLVKGEDITKFREAGKEYDITIRARESDRGWVKDVRDMMVTSPVGSQIPLNAVAEVKLAKGPSLITREDRQRCIKVQAAKGKRALSELIKDINTEIKSMSFPAGYSAEFGGEEESRREAFSGLFIALVAGIFLMYVILAMQFESLVHPFTVMLAIPLELIGVALALLITGQTVNIISMLGILMLTGIVVSNSILLVQFINLLRAQGKATKEAILEAGPIRLRPILMTAIATVFAMIPMALGMREGSEMFKPLAIAVLGGLITSTFLTLLVVPVVYSILDELGERLGLRKGG